MFEVGHEQNLRWMFWESAFISNLFRIKKNPVEAHHTVSWNNPVSPTSGRAPWHPGVAFVSGSLKDLKGPMGGNDGLDGAIHFF